MIAFDFGKFFHEQVIASDFLHIRFRRGRVRDFPNRPLVGWASFIKGPLHHFHEDRLDLAPSGFLQGVWVRGKVLPRLATVPVASAFSWLPAVVIPLPVRDVALAIVSLF